MPTGHLPAARTADPLAAATALASAVRAATTPANTAGTYAASWRVWGRFCARTGIPEGTGTADVLTAYAAWLLAQGKVNGTGYAPTSAEVHLTGAVVGLRERGHQVSKQAAADARTALDGLVVQLLKSGERRGRGQAPAADTDGIRRTVDACPETLAGARDRALVLIGFSIAARASELADLLACDVEVKPEGLVVHVRTAKTRHSIRDAHVPYGADERSCPVRAWTAYRSWLAAEAPEADDPAEHAFLAVDRWGNVRRGMAPDSITAAITRAAGRAGVALRWTGHSLRAGLATEARKRGRDRESIERQGGWAPGSAALGAYLRTVDAWTDNAASGLL
jgi:integrase